jgi:RNase P subunit RPR2
MNVRFLCPKKNELIVTDIAATCEVLQEHWSKVISCRCPHCGEIHSFSVRDAYIDGILSATAQDQRDLDNPLVRFAHFERQRREGATPVGTRRRDPTPRS